MAIPPPPSSREKILDVAESLFARRGYTGVGMREVADGVGLGKSSLFHHFRGKPALYCEVVGRILVRIRERLDPILVDPGTPMEATERLIGALVDVLAEHPNTSRILLRSLFEEEEFVQSPPAELEAVDAQLDAMLGGIRQLLEAGVSAGALREVSVPDLMQTLIGATVYHFASADIGERVLGESLFSAGAVARRKREIIDLLRVGILPPNVHQPHSIEDAT
jgi:AcrR family transcriptional regulator